MGFRPAPPVPSRLSGATTFGDGAKRLTFRPAFSHHGEDRGAIALGSLFRTSGAQQAERLTLFAELLARLHSLDWLLFASEVDAAGASDASRIIERELGSARQYMAIKLPMPSFLAGLAWAEISLETIAADVPCADSLGVPPGEYRALQRWLGESARLDTVRCFRATVRSGLDDFVGEFF